MLNVILDAWSSLAQSPWTGQPNWLGNSWPVSSADRGRFISQRYEADEGSLHYKLFIPSGQTGEPLPLIVMLHGGGQDADDFALGTGMNELAEQHKCFVVYPSQSISANWSMCWNWFEESHHQRGRGEPALIAGITRKVIAEHAIDETRVYVAGLSAGGAMAVVLGRTYPELFAAVGCHSGLAHGCATDSYSAMQAMKGGVDASAMSHPASATDVPVIVFHGDSDCTVHPSNSECIVQQFLASHAARVRHEQIDLSVSREAGKAGGRAFIRHVHKGKAGRVVAEHWTIKGSGHAWSGGTRRGSYADESGPNASREMLRFFLQRRRTRHLS
jgi:poly(hydroxyalkanoate) depolymerase family esterase